jgi:TonB family protein
MRRLPALSLLTVCIVTAVFAQAHFQPPAVTSVTDAYVPYQVVFDGFLVLNVCLDRDGKITDIEALRDPGAMLRATVTSIRTWKVRPGMLATAAISSEITAVFVYRPANNGPASLLPPKDFTSSLPHQPEQANTSLGYVPAGIVSVAYPDYPTNSVAWGSVIVQVTVDVDGKVGTTTVLYGTAPFPDLAIVALRKWRFRAATLHGKAVPSQVPIAFVFQTPWS